MAVGRGDARDGFFVRVGDSGRVPPCQGAGLVVLGGEGDGFADFEGEGVEGGGRGGGGHCCGGGRGCFGGGGLMAGSAGGVFHGVGLDVVAAATVVLDRRCVLPPVKHGDVAARAGLLERRFGVAEREAGVAPPVEDVHEAGFAGAVDGVGVVVFGVEGGGCPPPFEDGGFAEDGGGFGRQEGAAERRPEEVFVMFFEVGQEVGPGEFDDEFDAET